MMINAQADRHVTPGLTIQLAAAGIELPSVALPDLKSYKFTRLVAGVCAEDVDSTITVLRQQQSNWSAVERPAQTGDSVIINYFARHGERVFDGKSMRVELDGNDVIPGFESGMQGACAGEQLLLDIYFPEDHYQADIAGQTVKFSIEVVQVEANLLPELDTAFIKSQGIESGKLEDLKEVIHLNMDSHLQRVVRMKNTLTVFDEILETNPVDVPQALVDEEVKRLICDPCEEIEGVDSFKHDLDPANFTQLAYNRIARTLLATEIACAYSIELDTEEVRIRLEDLVSEYSDNNRVIEWFYEDRIRLASIESDVLGEQVVDWIFENSEVEDVTTSYRAMMMLTDITKASM